MLPYITIFKRIPTYGLAAVVGVLLSLIYLRLILKRNKSFEADAELAFVYGVIGAFVGAKLLSLLTVFREFLSEIQYLFSKTDLFLQKYLYGGFVFYGGLYGALFAVLLYCRLSKVSFSKIVSILLPTVVLIHGFGRIGCFCMGCCYGKPTDIGGVSFRVSEIAPNGIPLVPIQLYEAAVVFLLFALLAYRAFKNADGVCSLCIYLLIYGIARFLLEFWRGDGYRGFIGPCSVSQAISVCSVIVSSLLLRYRQRCSKTIKRADLGAQGKPEKNE